MNKPNLVECVGFKLDEASSAEPTGKITAQVTTWGPRESADGIRKFNYAPECFSEWVDEFNEAGKPIPMFYNHESRRIPIGEWNEFEITDEGMIGRGRMFLSTTEGSNVYNVMRESPGLLDGVSVGPRLPKTLLWLIATAR